MRKNLTAFAVLAAISGIAPAAVAETALGLPGRPGAMRGGELPAYTQNVLYARQQSGIELFGDAYTWWGQAAGRYDRGRVPRERAVLALRPHDNLRLGHVAAVSRVVDSRTILLRHANWSPIDGRRGQIEDDVRAVDVSPNNDWSMVRVWYGPSNDLGQTVWPTYGFIYPAKTPPRAAPRSNAVPARQATSLPRAHLVNATPPATTPARSPVAAPAPARATSAVPVRTNAAVQTSSNLRTLARAPESMIQQQRPAPQQPGARSRVAQSAAPTRNQSTAGRTNPAPVRSQNAPVQGQPQPAQRQLARRDVIGDLIRANR
ncbi:CHAP domain-containing protein [Croceibacterium xixiisoli]|uniref:CHAP domain-containing protein n=1 Tax=Croceibacterium xixiisoli TaxID=1476466 RepID=UPI001925F11E|nr:CHAP domain-containing protein [Croceibacterium xixiisoli]